MSYIEDRFGTHRGLVRAALGFAQARFLPPADLSGVERLVFVCHGNICRSAFADGFARKAGLASASFGLSTSLGKPAHAPVIAAARAHDVDLTSHLSTPIDDFDPLAGDLNLVMEVRQIGRLRRDSRFASARIDLLGRYGGMPHLHDPYKLSEAFTRSSLTDIERSVRGVIAAVERVRLSGPR